MSSHVEGLKGIFTISSLLSWLPTMERTSGEFKAFRQGPGAEGTQNPSPPSRLYSSAFPAPPCWVDRARPAFQTSASLRGRDALLECCEEMAVRGNPYEGTPNQQSHLEQWKMCLPSSWSPSSRLRISKHTYLNSKIESSFVLHV